MTQFPDLFAALAAPFEPQEVRVRSQAGRQLHYITARTAMNRLDDVLGPENWWDDFTPGENSVLCRLTLRLPDGQTITKADAGGYAGMPDSGDDDKSGFSGSPSSGPPSSSASAATSTATASPASSASASPPRPPRLPPPTAMATPTARPRRRRDGRAALARMAPAIPP